MPARTLPWMLCIGACAVPRSPRPVDLALDRRVEAVLERATEHELRERADGVLLPAREAAAPSAEAPLEEDQAAPPPSPVGALEVDLASALEIAFRTNRTMISRREALYLEVMSLIGTRHAFQPQLAALLGATFADSDVSPARFGADFSASLSQVLASGGVLTLSGSTSWADLEGSELDPDGVGTSLAARISQPLLRGYGYDVSHESLVQAERDLLYAVRSFELFREDFAIDVADNYYSLVEQGTALENRRRSIAVSIFQREKSEALYAIGKSSQIEVLRARRQELQDRNSLIQAEQAYELGLDRFKIFLGLDIGVPLVIVSQAPVFVDVDFDPSSAVEVAFANRLDHLTRLQQVEDVVRGLRLARDGLRSSLDLSLGYDLALEDLDREAEGWNAGLVWELPVDKVLERNAHRAAQIGLARARRDLEQFQHELEIEIRSAFRGLTRIRESIAIQEQLIEDQERNLKKAQIEYEAGTVSNREVVEAQESLVEAQNSLIREQVNHEIARLRLLRDLGILFVDETGMWREP